MTGDNSILDYAGKLLQTEVVAKNPNVIAVLNGHYHGSSIQVDGFDDNGDGIKERTVYQICTDTSQTLKVVQNILNSYTLI